MPRTTIPILGEHFPSQSKVQSVQSLVNFYLEEDRSQNRFIAYGTPGYAEWTDFNGSEVRGCIEHKSLGYVVVDNQLYKITNKNTKEALGTLNSNSGIVSIAATNNQIAVVDGVNLYIYNISGDSFAVQNSVNIPANPETVLAIDEYLVIPVPDSNQFNVSNLADGTSWSALSFASANSRADNINTMVRVNTLVMALCESSCEVFYNSGGETIPFDRGVAGSYDFGCIAKRTPIVIDNICYWLSANNNGLVGVVRSNGGLPSNISNRAMLQELSKYDSLSDAFGWSYQENGHTFYLITFPTTKTINGQAVGVTWAFDLSTNTWGIWESNLTNAIISPQPTRHTTNCHMYLNGEHLIGDHKSGKLYKLSPDYYTDNGEEIRRKIRTSHFVESGLKLSVNSLVLETESGVGLDGDVQGSDPQINLRYSKDRGRTWSSEITRGTGKVGEYNRACRFGRLGAGRSVTLELTCSDPIKWVILGATAIVSVESG